ncbi:apolipoprotein N-acyltransferase [candidate division KSB1 bacterium]|nr:apolipoprotein N-acyltransferase [candidate division KSB1 bacterium]
MKRKLTLGLSTSLLLAFSFPPFKTGFLAYVALIPFFLLLENKHGFDAFRWGYLTGLFIDIATLFWIGWVTVPGLFGALLILPLYIGLYALLHTFLIRNLGIRAYIILPFLWTCIEYIQSIGETAFPWNYIGYTQSYYLTFIQFAEYTSIYGVSFWVVLLNVLIFLLWRKWSDILSRRGLFFTLLGLFLIPFLHGQYVLNSQQQSQKKIKIALLQGNIDPFEKWQNDLYEKNFHVYENLSQNAINKEPDLLVWPETATPFYLRYEQVYLERIRNFVDSTKTALLTGSVDFEYLDDGSYLYYNSALGFEPNLYYIQRYAKMILVPFSERVPYKNYFPFNVLKNLLYDMALGIGDYSKGEDYHIFSFRTKSLYEKKNYGFTYKFAVPICYESVFPNHIRKLTQKGVDFLIIITNDAWFGKTSAPFQHTQIAVFRAIENRVAIARCANTGISCFIDAVGHVRKSTPIFKEASIIDDVPLRKNETFYMKFGNIFALVSLITTVICILSTLLLKKR